MNIFDTILGLLPSVKEPKKVPTIKSKLLWTVSILALYFLLGTITLIGLDLAKIPNLGFYQTVLASNMGTLISLGIGPIVTSSIILQLLVGVKLINLDFSNPQHRSRFSGMQKLFAILLAIVESFILVKMGMLQALPGMFLVVVLQIALGSILLIYLDEIVSKYGIGSGIGLFIAAGVCQSIFWRVFSIPSAGNTGGLLFLGYNYLVSGATIQLLTAVLLPILFTLIVFFAVIYAEGMHVNIPLTVGRSGMGAKYPVKLLYVSNMPVILAATLIANINMFASMSTGNFFGKVLIPLSNVLSPPYQLIQTIFLGGATWMMVLQALVYMLVFVGLCVLFGKFWVEVGGQGVDSVAQQLQKSGMSIPGFRRDQRVIVTVLKRYIPTIVVLGSIFVGLLAFLADLTGALGTGTGILLTVGIVYRFYEQLAKEQVFESSSFLKQLTGSNK